MDNRIYHVGISGGKDSTALLLWAVYESGLPHTQIVASFCDTQNEADCTYEHIYKLSRDVFPIVWLQSEGFFQLAKRKKRFPSPKARFCTQELKLKPSKSFIESLSEYGEVVGMSGIRRGESPARAKMSEWGNPLESYFNIQEWRPLIDWTLADVIAIHERYGVALNPLYMAGARRVGCFPCIMSGKPELRMIAKKYPERFDKIRQHEEEMKSTFFPPNMIPDRFKNTEWVSPKDGRIVKLSKIDNVIEWAKTGKGAKGLPADDDLFAEQTKDMPPEICLAQHLACE